MMNVEYVDCTSNVVYFKNGDMTCLVTDKMKKVISSLYNEYISDFKNAFQECVDLFTIQIIPDGLSRTDAISSILSFYINQGVWTALRIIPTKFCAFEKIMFHGKEQVNYDYIVNPIMTFNKNFELEPVFDNQQFYSDAASDCFLYFLTLTKRIYNSEIEIRLDRLEAEVETLKRNDIEKANMLASLTQFKDEYLSKKIQNKKLASYQSLSHEELINRFYDFYKVPHDFLDIIQTYPFEGKIILSKDFKIANDYQTLIISYLDGFVDDRKDMALIKILFHIESQNPSTSKKGYKKRLNIFKDFIKNHTKYKK